MIIFRHYLKILIMSLLLPGISHSQDTLICDNGGFEDDFDYYNGKVATFYKGSSSCTPGDVNYNPVTFSTLGMPSFRRFEIVGSGADALTGISQVKFGNKSMRLNNRWNHSTQSSACNTGRDVNRITKRFKVTEGTRHFTVWFAAVLENPALHDDSQPFFSISCDLAPDYDFCFDANSVSPCKISASDDSCNYEDGIIPIDWVCHKISLSEDKIGQIANLEITAADCGCGAHFGYAYIDGICEECSGTVLGSGYIPHAPFDPVTGIGIKQIKTCRGDTMSICGSYTDPLICNLFKLDSFRAPGFNLLNKSIDTVNKRFCFDLLRSDLQDMPCRDLTVQLFFKRNQYYLPPVSTNTITLCIEDFPTFIHTVTIGDCNNNNTSDIFSDDYYYVDINITNLSSETWTIIRDLDDPYPNESGRYTLLTGSGNTNQHLPFMIQEGSWDLIITIGHCTYTYQISPPDYCSGCAPLAKTKISNIVCNSNGTWTFDVYVPYSNPQQGEYILINGGTAKNFNTTYTISAGNINQSCFPLAIEYINENTNENCIANFQVCPPKPCNNNEDCELEVYLSKIDCLTGGATYSVELKVSGASYPCYRSIGDTGGGSFSNPLGPFTVDNTLVIYTCSTATCSCNPTCFKVLKVYKPEDCDTRNFGGGSTSRTASKLIDEVKIIPNPIHSDYFTIESTLDETVFVIFDASGKRLTSGQFLGKSHPLRCSLSPGIYFLSFKKSTGSHTYIKFIKL